MAKQMMSSIVRTKVFVPGKASRKQAQAGVEPDPKKYGKVHNLVFAPDSRRMVGIMVRRPDVAGMVKQDDRFVPLDSVEFHEGGLLCAGTKESFDAAACKRLGLDLDHCIIWEGADVICESGKFLGYVMDASLDVTTGEVDCFCAQEGNTASELVGFFEIPAAWVVRYDKGRMIVKDQAADLELSGGLAAKAGEGYAQAKDSAKKATAKFDEKASVAVDKGAHGLGKLIGKAKRSVQQASQDYHEAAGAPEKAAGASSAKPAAKQANASEAGTAAARAVGEQLGKTRGMFSSFMKEFKDASK